MNNHHKNYPRGNFFLKNDYSPRTLILQIINLQSDGSCLWYFKVRLLYLAEFIV